MQEQLEEVIELLQDVRDKKGAYSRDILTHAENVIKSSSERADKAIKILEEIIRNKFHPST